MGDRGEGNEANESGPSPPLVALVTIGSADRLALDSGVRVAATRKPTATRIVPRDVAVV